MRTNNYGNNNISHRIIAGSNHLCSSNLKGLDVFTSTILVSFIIILTSWMDWWTSLSSYAEGYVGFIQNNVFVLVIGAVFGELMAASGCAESIANVVTEKMGAKRVILSIALITTVFVYVGVSGFVVLFVLAPIATIMMKQAGYPYRMIPGIIFIGATCSAMIPYAINITNIMPAQYLGTSMGSAPILGWVAFVVSLQWDIFTWFMQQKKQRSKREQQSMNPSQLRSSRQEMIFRLFWVALIPFILVVVLVLALSNLTEMNTNAIVVLSMFVGSVVIVLFCHKQVGSVAKILEKGVNNGIGATVMAAAILGFSGVLQSCPGFQAIINFVMGLKMNPYLTEFFGLNILAGILGSGTSSIAMFFEHLSDGLLAKGASAGALHRLAPACASGMNTLPNAGGMVAQLRWMKLSLAESYWYVFMTSVLAPMIGSLAAVIVAMIIY